MEDILAVSRNTSWRPPLEENDDYQALHGVSMSPNYLGTPARQGRGEGGDDLINFRDPSILPPRSSHDGYYGSSRPWWFPAQPPSSDQRNNPQQLPPIVDLHVSAIGSRSVSSSVLGGSSSSSDDHTPGETPLPTSIPLIHRPSGRSHYSTSPTPSRDSSLRIQQEQEKHDRFNNRISQAIMARLRASQRPSATTAPVRAYSHCTTIGSEVSRAPSYPIISMSRTQTDVMRSSYTPHNVYCQGVEDSSERLWPSLMLPPTPSPSPTHTLRMVEGLLDPVTNRPPQASTASFQDHNDYSRRFNGCVCFPYLLFRKISGLKSSVFRCHFFYSLLMIIFKVRLLWRPWIWVKEGHEFRQVLLLLLLLALLFCFLDTLNNIITGKERYFNRLVRRVFSFSSCYTSFQKSVVPALFGFHHVAKQTSQYCARYNQAAAQHDQQHTRTVKDMALPPQLFRALENLRDQVKDAIWALSSCLCQQTPAVKINGRTCKF